MPKWPINIWIIILISISLFVSLFSISNLLKANLPTLYTLIFGYSIFLLLGAVYYKKNPTANKPHFFLPPPGPILFKFLTIIYFSILTYVLIILTKSLYLKPDVYYFLTSFAVVILSYLIITGEESKKEIYLIQIIFLSTILRGSSLFINTHLLGPDSEYHIQWVHKIIELGHLDPNAFHYYYFPSYHLIQSISSDILGFSKLSVDLVNLSISIIPIIAAYLIGYELFNNYKAGLLSALLLSIQPLHIFLSVFNTSKIGGAALLVICLLLLIKINKNNDPRIHILLWISVITLFLWHPETSFPLMALLCGGASISYIIKRKFEIDKALLLYIVVWLFYIFLIHITLGTGIINSIFMETSQPALVQPNVNYIRSNIDLIFLIQAFVSYIGVTLLVFFVSYTGLKWMETSDKIGLFIIFSLLFAHILPAIGIFFGKFGFGPDRTLVAVAVILSIISSGALMNIFRINCKKTLSIFLLFMFIISFVSTSSYLIGDNNNIFHDRIPRQTVFVTNSLFNSHAFIDDKAEEDSVIIQSDYNIINWDSTKKIDYLAINRPNLNRWMWEESISYPLIMNIMYASECLYNNGDNNIYKIA